MNKLLLKICLAVSPFALFPEMNTRDPKEILCLSLVLAISMVTIYQGEIKKFTNKWLLSLVGFCFASMVLAPKFVTHKLAYFATQRDFQLYDISASHYNVWMFKPLYYVMVYFLFIICVSSIKFKSNDISHITNIISRTGAITSFYIFVQHFNIDQIFRKVTEEAHPYINGVETPLLGSFLGNSTLASAFILIAIPFMFYRKHYFSVIASIIAIILTKSTVAVVGICFILTIQGYYSLIKRKVKKYIIVLITVLIIASLGIGYKVSFDSHKDFSSKLLTASSGRFGVWKIAIDEWKREQTPTSLRKFSLSGLGPGSYRYVVPLKYKTRFLELHCEPMELLFNVGLIGFILFIMSLFYMLKQAFKYLAQIIDNDLVATLLISFTASLFTACFTLTWQLPTTLFLTTVIVGLLHNEELLTRSYNYE